MLKPAAMMLMAALGTVLATGPANAAELPKPQETQRPGVLFQDWGKTLAIRSRDRRDVMMCFWFYEWHMFDAVEQGPHTLNATEVPWNVRPEGDEAVVRPPGMTLKVKAVADGAELLLNVTNQSDHDWPELASIIPCFNPGSIRGPNTNTRFIDDFYERTYYLAPAGLTLLKDRAFHCRSALRDRFAAPSRDSQFAWSSKWPLSEEDASGGLMVREGKDGQWVAGIAWDRYLSCQGHNPWKCLHLSVNLGPLKRGESRTVRGRVYLFQGTKEHCLKKYLKEFGEPGASS